MKKKTRHPPYALDRHGVPVDPNDWTVDDWHDLWFGMNAVRALIARRHAKMANEPKELPVDEKPQDDVG